MIVAFMVVIVAGVITAFMGVIRNSLGRTGSKIVLDSVNDLPSRPAAANRSIWISSRRSGWHSRLGAAHAADCLPIPARELQIPCAGDRPHAPKEAGPALWAGEYLSHGKGLCWHGQTRGAAQLPKSIAKDTLLFGDLGFANVGEKPGMGRAAFRVVRPGFTQAEIAVHGQAYFAGCVVFLAVVLPPADRAQSHRAGGLQRPVPTARTAKTTLQSSPPFLMEEE